MRRIIMAAASAAFTLSGAATAAAPTFDFLFQVGSYQGSSGVFQASGTFTCDGPLDSNNRCIVVGITGTVYNPTLYGTGFTLNITGLSGFNGADQVITYVTDMYHPFGGDLTLGGLSFTTSCSAASSTCADPFGQDYNFFSRGLDSLGRLRILESDNLLGDGNKAGVTASFHLSPTPSAAPVPEPAAWTLMLLGFGAIGLALRRRQFLLSEGSERRCPGESRVPASLSQSATPETGLRRLLIAR